MAITTTGPISAGGVLTATAPVGGTITPNAYLSIQISYTGGVTATWGVFGPLLLGTGSFLTIVNQGVGYVSGTYTNVPITGFIAGEGALATVTVTLGQVTLVNITSGGENYVNTEYFTIPNSFLGGTGSGFEGFIGQSNALASSNFIQVEAYGTGGTTGTGAAGTYQTTALGATIDPISAQEGIAGSGVWIVATTPTGSATPIANQIQPVPSVPLSAVQTVPTTFAGVPPTPLPQTLVGTTNVTSYSI